MKRSLMLLIFLLAACDDKMSAAQAKALAKHKQDTEDCHKHTARTPLKNPADYGKTHENCMKERGYIVGK